MLYTLKTTQVLTHDTKLYTLVTKNGQGTSSSSPLRVASCYRLTLNEISRPYTPVNIVDSDELNFIIKNYGTGFSGAVASLKIGSDVAVDGPFLKFAYNPNQWKKLGMLAAGTGITPMYQVIQKILSNSSDKTEIYLVYSSKSCRDIILKAELDAMFAEDRQRRFKSLHYMVTDGSPVVEGPSGPPVVEGPSGPPVVEGPSGPPVVRARRLTKDMILDWMPGCNEEGVRILVCGTPGFYVDISGPRVALADVEYPEPVLAKAGFDPDTQVFKY